MIIHWTLRAIRKREKIYEHIDNENPAAAAKIDTLIAQQAALLLENPEIGRKGCKQGTRELVAHRRYILIYKVQGSAVTILNVLHTSQKWPL